MGAKRLHLLDTESRGRDPWYGVNGARGQGGASQIYIHGTNSKDKKIYMNMRIWGVVDRGTECHGKEVSMI